MYSIRLEGDTQAALRRIRSLSEIDRRGINAALGQAVRESTLERFQQSRDPDGRRWKSSDAAETIFERFLSLLDAGLYVDGNFVSIDFEGSEWVDADDSILKAKVAVQTFITFHGGLYRDTGFAPLRYIEVKEIEKNARKKPANGD